MKNVHFLQDFAAHKAGERVLVEDQLACDAIACGAAVPNVQAIVESAPNKPASKAK